jgi:hypothetical protein
MLTRTRVTAGLLLLAVALCWALPRVADMMVGNTSIVFYGEVESDNGFSIEGAQIKAHVIGTDRLFVPFFWSNGSEQFKVDLSATSDRSGRFTLTCDRGHSLIFDEIVKPDYDRWMVGSQVAETHQGAFYYRGTLSPASPARFSGPPHVPDWHHPVMFRLPYNPKPPRETARLPWGARGK